MFALFCRNVSVNKYITHSNNCQLVIKIVGCNTQHTMRDITSCHVLHSNVCSIMCWVLHFCTSQQTETCLHLHFCRIQQVQMWNFAEVSKFSNLFCILFTMLFAQELWYDICTIIIGMYIFFEIFQMLFKSV